MATENKYTSEELSVLGTVMASVVARADCSPEIMKQFWNTTSELLRGTAAEPVVEELKPAVSIRKSVTPDYIVCLEDGKKLKMLKRHLRSTYDMSPEDYRKKWGLPTDYPMTAPNYANQRSELAKQIGLGRSRSSDASSSEGSAPKAKRSRKVA